MALRVNVRLAGITLLIDLVTGICSHVLFNQRWVNA